MTRPDDTFRRAEGSGPWLHPPRKPAPRRFPSLAIWCAAWIVAGLLATIAIPAPDMPHGPEWEMCGKEWRC